MLDLSNKRDLYSIYKRKKSNGRLRTIFAPKPDLKIEQEKVAAKIEAIYTAPACVFGFIKGKSATDAAKLHTNKDWVITMDMKDFFPSITRDMIHISMIISEYDSDVCTLDDKLVQGSPASPIISNKVMLPFDIYMSQHFLNLGITYTRYADDITLSGMGKPKWEYVKYIDEWLNDIGFKLNPKKTKFMLKKDKQEVLGITVNTVASVTQQKRKVLRAKIHQGNVTEADEGYLAYINSVNPEQYKKLKGL